MKLQGVASIPVLGPSIPVSSRQSSWAIHWPTDTSHAVYTFDPAIVYTFGPAKESGGSLNSKLLDGGLPPLMLPSSLLPLQSTQSL